VRVKNILKKYICQPEDPGKDLHPLQWYMLIKIYMWQKFKRTLANSIFFFNQYIQTI